MAQLFVYTNLPDMPPEHQDLFWNFSPDDWDFFILGTDEMIIDQLAEKLAVCEHRVRRFPNGLYAAVTYHA